MISVGFLVSSLLCSFAWNLESMIVFRAMQGFWRRADSAGVHPWPWSSAGTPPSEGHGAVRHHRHLRALHRTDPGRLADENFGWEYIFYINVPPGLLMIAGLLYGLEKRRRIGTAEGTDYSGIVTLGIGLGCLQVFLEEGHRKDWLESQLIDQPRQRRPVQPGPVRHPAAVAAEPADRPGHPAQPQLRPREHFQHRSGHGPVRLDHVLPLYLAQIQGYNAMQIGEVIMWMGIPQLFLIPLVPKLMKLVSPRLLCPPASACSACQLLLRSAQPGLRRTAVQPDPATAPLGQPMIMVTISLIATAYLQPQDAGSASSLFNILRNLGGAIGIALLATLLDSRAKVYFDYLREAWCRPTRRSTNASRNSPRNWAASRRRWANSARSPTSRR